MNQVYKSYKFFHMSVDLLALLDAQLVLVEVVVRVLLLRLMLLALRTQHLGRVHFHPVPARRRSRLPITPFQRDARILPASLGRVARWVDGGERAHAALEKERGLGMQPSRNYTGRDGQEA